MHLILLRRQLQQPQSLSPYLSLKKLARKSLLGGGGERANL